MCLMWKGFYEYDWDQVREREEALNAYFQSFADYP